MVEWRGDGQVEVYPDEAGEFRWRRRAGNNKIVSSSGEGFTERNDAREAGEKWNPGVPVVILESEYGRDSETET